MMRLLFSVLGGMVVAGCGSGADGPLVAIAGAIEVTAPFGEGFGRSAICDCDGDGVAEVVLARHDAIEAWHVAADGAVSPAPFSHPYYGGATAVELADLDGDGETDMLSGGFGGVDLYPGVGPCAFGEPIALPRHDGITVHFQVVDVNGDGRLDILDARQNDSVPVRIYLAPDWSEAVLPAPPKARSSWLTFGAALHDVDGDGNLDLFVLADHGYAWFAWGLGGARWQVDAGDWTASLADCEAMSVAPIDYDRDGKLEYFIGGNEGRSRLWRSGSRRLDDRAGDAHCEGNSGIETWGAAASDLDGDGLPDLLALALVSNSGAGPRHPRVLLNLGGTFGHANAVDTLIAATELTCGNVRPGLVGCVAGGLDGVGPVLLVNRIKGRR